MDTAQSIRLAIARRNVTKRWLAERMDVTPQHVSNLCNGNTSLGLNGVIQVAAIFDVPVSEFIRWGEM